MLCREMRGKLRKKQSSSEDGESEVADAVAHRSSHRKLSWEKLHFGVVRSPVYKNKQKRVLSQASACKNIALPTYYIIASLS